VSEYDHEPILGLPEDLPAGEHILWQGSPDWQGMAKGAFHIRGVAIYFALLLGWALTSGSLLGIGLTLVGTGLGLAIIAALAWISARTTIYTITSRRVVLRFGMALQKCVNLPLSAVGGAGISIDDAGRGDIPLQLSGAHRLGYLQFWPHARPWKLSRPEPMLRAVPDAGAVARLLGQALRSANPGSNQVFVEQGRAAPVRGEALAA
jgi:hypothetical protein